MILRPIVDESLVQAPRTRYAISAHLGFRCSRSAMQLGPQRSRWHLAKVGATSHGERPGSRNWQLRAISATFRGWREPGVREPSINPSVAFEQAVDLEDMSAIQRSLAESRCR